MDDYSLFEESTKKYLKKAMEIYAHLNQRRPIILKKLDGSKMWPISQVDSIVLSLFMSGLMTDGNLKEILKQYPEFNIDEIFNMINLNEEEIEPMPEISLEDYYSYCFRSTLCEMLNIVTGLEKDYLIFNDSTPDFVFEEITPEVIFSFFTHPEVQNKYRLIWVLSYIYKPFLNGKTFDTHPCFIEIEKKVSPLRTYFDKVEKINNEQNVLLEKIKQQFDKNDVKLESEYELEVESESIDQDKRLWDKLDLLLKKFIGQETATEHLFYNIVNNQKLALGDKLQDGERSIIFFDGPSGTGKTAITRSITEALDIPVSLTASTSYSATGYVGGNLTDILKELYRKAKGDLKKAERGIVVLDEFDKLAQNGVGSLEMKKAVQQQLLDFMGGGKYVIEVEKGTKVQFDTSKLTFVCLGALTHLRKQKTTRKSAIGFTTPLTSNISEINDYSITPQDLCFMGIEKELVGRFNTYIHTEDYSIESLLRILKESEISPLKSLNNWVVSNGKKLEIEDGVYEEIAKAAYRLNTGARGLQTVITNIRTYFMKDVFRGTKNVIHLDSETVINIINGVTNRKGRR